MDPKLFEKPDWHGTYIQFVAKDFADARKRLEGHFRLCQSLDGPCLFEITFPGKLAVGDVIARSQVRRD